MSDDARRFGLDVPEVLPQRVPCDFGERAGQLDAGRPAADDDEGQQTPLAHRIALPLCRFERQQHPPPHLERIVERLEARAREPPIPDARNRSASRRSATIR